SVQTDPRWTNWIGGKGNCLNQLGLALAYQRLDHSEEAREMLADGALASDKGASGTAGRRPAREMLADAAVSVDRYTQFLFNSREVPYIRVWQEWLEALLIYREAKLLVDGTPPPDDPRLWVVRGRALAALNLKDQAAAAAARAATLAPMDAAIHSGC